jgi:hypothetical protein
MSFQLPFRLSGALPALLFTLYLPLYAASRWPEQDAGTFTGFWSMSGTVHIVELPDGGIAAGGGLTGTVTIQTSQGPIPSFDTDCVVFHDGRSKGVGRCIWTATNGDRVVVHLESDGPAGSGSVAGSFTGGTGEFASLSGQFQFEWSYTVRGGADAQLDGSSYTMTGRYDLRGP